MNNTISLPEIEPNFTAAEQQFLSDGTETEREADISEVSAERIAAGGLTTRIPEGAPKAAPGEADNADPAKAEPSPSLEETEDGEYENDGRPVRDSVGQYLHEIGLVPLLNKKGEQELAKRVESGREAQARLEAGQGDKRLEDTVRDGKAARDTFIKSNLRLVVSIARRYPLPPGMDLLDLIQEGNLGLEHAVEKFDWRKGFKFSTYATFWIRQAIGRALDQKGHLVRLPTEPSARLRAALRTGSGEEDELDDELANLYRLATPTSLDRTVDDGEQELVDLLPDALPGPEQMVIEKIHEEMVADLLGSLDDPRVRTAVEYRFGFTDGEKHSFREVGEILGVTAEAARRMVKRAIDGLKKEANEASTQSYD